MSHEADANSGKLFIGARFRRLRRQLARSQTRMAEELGISASYVNLIERNQRPVTAQILLKMAQTYDIDLRDLAAADKDRAFIELNEVFSDALFRSMDLAKQELHDFAELCPNVVAAVQRLYRGYIEARQGETMAAARLAGRDQAPTHVVSPVERVRDLIEANRNHFASLEAAAEQLRDELGAPSDALFRALSDRLRERHGILVRILPVEVMQATLRRWVRHQRQLHVSELLDGPSRNFQLAFQITLMEIAPAIDDIVAQSKDLDDAARRLFRASLANYSAAAIIMPYTRFQEAAETLGYDIGILQQRFGASFEQVCHRLTTLQRPNARGVPFFMLRIDHAGNVSKRFSSGSFPFSKYGGTCPLWNVHATFDRPGHLVRQVIELPDGNRYFSIARTIDRLGAPYGRPAPRYAIGLGCELKYAQRLVYSAGLNLDQPEATPIGINCRLCERADCGQRAEPPLTRPLLFDESIRGASPFMFQSAYEA